MCVFKKHLKTSWIASSLGEIVTDPPSILCPQKCPSNWIWDIQSFWPEL